MPNGGNSLSIDPTGIDLHPRALVSELRPQKSNMEGTGDLRHETLADALSALAKNQSAAPALHVPGRKSLTWGELGAQIRYVRERLGGWGIAPGDVIAGVIPSRPEMAVACATLPSSSTFAPL